MPKPVLQNNSVTIIRTPSKVVMCLIKWVTYIPSKRVLDSVFHLIDFIYVRNMSIRTLKIVNKIMTNIS